MHEAVQELQRCAKIGLRGALIWCSPPAERPYSSPDYDPFWAAAQDLNMPLSLHSITGMGPESRLLVKEPIDRYLRSTILSHEVQRSLTVLIFSGVGVENIMWSSDYPHTVSTWPHSQEVVARDLQGVPEEEAQKIIWDNAARLYGIN